MFLRKKLAFGKEMMMGLKWWAKVWLLRELEHGWKGSSLELIQRA